MALISADSGRLVGMAGPQIRAVIEDGPRGGETVVIDVESENHPPPEILLPDGHQGTRATDGSVPHPTGAVSRYRLAGPAEGRSGFVYKVVPHGS